MAEAIVKILAAGISWLAAKGIDSLVGKWVAFFMAAWEKSANDRARAAYHETMKLIIPRMADKYQDWSEWRRKILEGQAPPPEV